MKNNFFILLFLFASSIVLGQNNIDISNLTIKVKYYDKTGYCFEIFEQAVGNKNIKLKIENNSHYINGYVSYEFLYRSHLDTPNYQRDFQQHTERIVLKTNFLSNIPVSINISARQSNSPFIKNTFNFNYKLDKTKLKKQLFEVLKKESNHINTLKEALTELSERRVELNELLKKANNSINDERIKETIAAEQISFFQNNSDSIKNLYKSYNDLSELPNLDSVFPKLGQFLKLKEKFNSYKNEVNIIDKEYANLNKTLKSKISATNQSLNNGTIDNDLKEELKHIKNQKGIKSLITLNQFKTLEVGQTLVNYSELTANNLFINGVNFEYNPSAYFALASGKVFNPIRNIVSLDNNQKVNVFRVGKGNVSKKGVIFSYFNGSQNKYGYIDSIKTKEEYTGISLQYIYKPDGENGIVAEVAKSTIPYLGAKNKKAILDIFDFENTQNLAYTIDGNFSIMKLNSNIEVRYKKQGNDFQSLNFFNLNSEQTNYFFRYKQNLLKNSLKLKLGIEGGLFNNRLVQRNYGSKYSTTTAQISFVKRRFPTVDMGLIPTRQTIINERNNLEEFLFINKYITASQLFKIKQVNLNTIFSIQQNKNINSNLESLNSSTTSLQNLFYSKKVIWQTNLYLQKRSGFDLKTIEIGSQFSIGKTLRITFLEKLNDINNDLKIGHELGMQLNLKNLGVIDFNYIDNFNVNFYNNLINFKMARLSFVRYF